MLWGARGEWASLGGTVPVDPLAEQPTGRPHRICLKNVPILGSKLDTFIINLHNDFNSLITCACATLC